MIGMIKRKNQNGIRNKCRYNINKFMIWIRKRCHNKYNKNLRINTRQYYMVNGT